MMFWMSPAYWMFMFLAVAVAYDSGYRTAYAGFATGSLTMFGCRVYSRKSPLAFWAAILWHSACAVLCVAAALAWLQIAFLRIKDFPVQRFPMIALLLPLCLFCINQSICTYVVPALRTGRIHSGPATVKRNGQPFIFWSAITVHVLLTGFLLLLTSVVISLWPF